MHHLSPEIADILIKDALLRGAPAVRQEKAPFFGAGIRGKTMRLRLIGTVLTLILVACGQSAPTPDRHTLQSVNSLPLPAKLIDKIYEDPGVPPYRFQLFVTEGWFRLEGNKYRQQIRFHSTAEGYPDGRWTWSEFGTCAPSGSKLLCESGYIQNYRFELTQQGDSLVTRQNFTDPALEATYTFRR